MNLSDLEVKRETLRQELDTVVTRLRQLEGAILMLNELIIGEQDGADTTSPVRDAEVGTTEEAGGTPEGDVGPA